MIEKGKGERETLSMFNKTTSVSLACTADSQVQRFLSP